MRSDRGSPAGRWAFTGAVIALLLVVGPAFSPPSPAGPARPPIVAAGASVPFDASMVAGLRAGPRVAVNDSPSDQPLPGSILGGGAVPGDLSVVVTLRYSNASRLTTLLALLADPDASHRPPYLTEAQFDREFGPSPSVYRSTVAFLRSYGVQSLATYADRATISFEAAPAVAGEIFGVSIGTFIADHRIYLAPRGPIDLPASIAAGVLQVEGLSTSPASTALSSNLGGPALGAVQSPASPPIPSVTSYLPPATLGTAQIEYAPDLQVAYDEQSLFTRYGDPTNVSVALITGSGGYTGAVNSTRCGALTPGQDLGPWDPSDISSFFAKTLPRAEAVPKIVPVPLGGAALPSCLASWNGTGTTAANAVDLEMIGSTAPGATIYGVYEPTLTQSGLDAEFATVLSPGSSVNATLAAGLANVSVIATPWGFADDNDTSWHTSLENAEARGISILAATGDSADDPASAHWAGSAVEFPASMAFTTVGDTAVGGTTVRLNSTTLQLSDQTTWYLPPDDSAQGGPAGTAGGPSEVFRQPHWQKETSAGSLLGSLGRGVPDVAALANDSATTVTRYGRTYLATNASAAGRFYNASGTGVAVSLVAGEFAEIDHALRSEGAPPLGFADPTIYPLANLEYSPLPSGNVHGSAVTGSYDESLPTLPFRDVVGGRNDQYRAGAGYDLVTGWGSLDVYNFSVYLLPATHVPGLGPLSAIQDWVNLTGLGVAGATPDASVQQNLFLANSLGAPVIWVQSVLYLSQKPSGAWTVNFTGWVVYPFFGLYPTESVYTFWFPSTGRTQSMPISWDLTTSLQPASPQWNTTVTFSFGNGITPIVLPAPGAAYLMGADSSTYHWQGATYTDGPRGPVADVPGFLAPQIGLYGYPGGGASSFTAATSGTIAAYVRPLGATTYEAGRVGPVTLANTQTGEVGEDLSYIEVTPNLYSIGYSAGSTEQGITVTEPYRYVLAFDQTGAPSSASWSVTLSSGPHLTASGSTPTVTFPLQNGTYSWSATVSLANYTFVTPNGSVTVDGGVGSVDLVILLRQNIVNFSATGPPAFPFAWSVVIASGPTLSGTGPTLESSLTYGKYSYRIESANSSWAPSTRTGSFTIGRATANIDVTFVLQTFSVQIRPIYGIGQIPWSVTLGGVTRSGHATHILYFPLPNGTYTYRITGLPPRYRADPSSGTIVVHGSPAPFVDVRIIAPPNLGGPFGLGIWGYLLIGGVVAVAVALVIFLRRRQRRRRALRAESEATERRTPGPKSAPPRGRSQVPKDPSQPPSRQWPRNDRYIDPDEL